jgi:hypothetical protein
MAPPLFATALRWQNKKPEWSSGAPHFATAWTLSRRMASPLFGTALLRNAICLGFASAVRSAGGFTSFCRGKMQNKMQNKNPPRSSPRGVKVCIEKEPLAQTFPFNKSFLHSFLLLK